MKPAALILLLGFIIPAAAQAPTPSSHTAAELAQIETKILAAAAASPGGSANQQMDTLPNSYTLLVARVHTGEAELHKEYADQFVMVHGSLTLVTGGTLTAPKPQADPNEIRSPALEGGKEITLHPGDIARVPAGIPHWVKLAPGTTVTYLVFKQK
jgi:mannose-6-phosphate isomerase-like protein (cupin superfamily)